MRKKGGRFERLMFDLTFSQMQRNQAEKKSDVKSRCNVFGNICFVVA